MPKRMWDCPKAEVQEEKELERPAGKKEPFLKDSLFSQHCIETWLLQWDLNLTDLQFPPSLLLLLLLPGHSLGSLSLCLPSVFLLFLLGQVFKVSSDAACFIGNCNKEKNSKSNRISRFYIKVAWNEFLLQISTFLPSELIVQSKKSFYSSLFPAQTSCAPYFSSKKPV